MQSIIRLTTTISPPTTPKPPNFRPPVSLPRVPSLKPPLTHYPQPPTQRLFIAHPPPPPPAPPSDNNNNGNNGNNNSGSDGAKGFGLPAWIFWCLRQWLYPHSECRLAVKAVDQLFFEPIRIGVTITLATIGLTLAAALLLIAGLIANFLLF